MGDAQKLGRDINLRVNVERFDVVDTQPTSSALSGALEVVKARISLASSGQHVEYTIGVECNGQRWSVRKRFSEVAQLHETLVKRLPSMPQLPSKSAVRHFSPEYLETRRSLLAAYLKELVSRRDVCNSKETWAFFGLARDPAFRPQEPVAEEPSQAAEVHESTYGIVDFAYDPVQGLLVLGGTDNSWASRMDTKITNMKLPWEPEAPNLPTSQMTVWRQSPADLRFEMQLVCRYTASISCVALLLAGDRGHALCGLSDGTVGWQDVKATGSDSSQRSKMDCIVPLLRHTAAVVAIAVDDAEMWVITASKDNALKVFDIRRQAMLCEVSTPQPTASMHYCQTAKQLFTGLQTGRIFVWDLSRLPAMQLCAIPSHNDAIALTKISALDFDPSTGTLFAGSREGISLWAVKQSGSTAWGRSIGQIQPVSAAPSAIAWSNSSREIMAAFPNGTVAVFDLDAGKPGFVLDAHRSEVSSLCWQDAPRRLLTASKDKTLKIWDFPSLRSSSLTGGGGGGGGSRLNSLVHDSNFSSASAAPPPSSQSFSASAASNRGSTSGGMVTSSFAGAGDPLRRPPSSSAGGGFSSSSAAAAGGYPVNGGPTASSAAAAAASASSVQKPRVAGAAPGALFQNDSDDDLAGWDK
mmetsp:Transcript_28757/g.66803  ORF Transcript_28757/g.66803 Transcript_28757/m.66803 type:complete len:639 (+) Transcript_28757:192-2108(+)|eukprot:CAMPEP_0178440676 /NCGR_PEP_ID=MMETSP0689_2-20121128/36930_1 /TAXON_ID=160604 /ORGANISM="Amphidinium massartii, Strain CS-259" /LENGTH=638 /DNA_ID=CAMNT_0020063515 /DNA_START=108 /DNA_END=2024 /DNA_ORIENTATION=+